MWVNLSGVSKNLLDETGKFKEKETIKYARYGRLIVIPAILGGIAGSYAISTILDNLYLKIAFGFLWFFIILSVDMAISATMYKSKNNSSIGFWISVIFRLIFSVCVGVVISHPLVLRIFEPSIEKWIEKIDIKNKNQEVLSARIVVDSAKKEYNDKIEKLELSNECLGRLIQFESSKDNNFSKEFFDRSNNSCGVSSGKGAGCSTECRDRKKIIKDNIAEITKTKKERDDNTKPEEAILKSADDKLSKQATKDYLARTEALDALANGDKKEGNSHPHVSIAAKSLICFFVVLDCLIVIFKASTPMGAYEHTNDVLLDQHISDLQAEIEAHSIYIKTISQGKAKVKAKQEVVLEEVLEMQTLITSALKRIDKEKSEFKTIKKRMLEDVGLFEFDKRRKIKQQLDAMENLYFSARNNVIDKLSENMNLQSQ